MLDTSIVLIPILIAVLDSRLARYGLLHRIPPPETVLPSSVPLGVAARPESIPKTTPTASNAANVPTVGSGAGNAVREDADDGYFLNPVVQAT